MVAVHRGSMEREQGSFNNNYVKRYKSRKRKRYPEKYRGKYTRNVKIPKYLQGYVRTGGNWGSIEQKYFDTSISNAIDLTNILEVLTTNPIGSLNAVPQGTQPSERVGLKITITSIALRFQIHWGGTASSDDLARIMLVLDTQANGATITPADLLLDDSNIHSYMNMANSERFKVLKDWKITRKDPYYNSNVGVGAVEAPPEWIEWYKKVEIPVVFSSTTGAIAEIKSNNLVLLGMTQENGIDTIGGLCRIRFTDL